jgi:hypothetical protein
MVCWLDHPSHCRTMGKGSVSGNQSTGQLILKGRLRASRTESTKNEMAIRGRECQRSSPNTLSPLQGVARCSGELWTHTLCTLCPSPAQGPGGKRERGRSSTALPPQTREHRMIISYRISSYRCRAQWSADNTSSFKLPTFTPFKVY